MASQLADEAQWLGGAMMQAGFAMSTLEATYSSCPPANQKPSRGDMPPGTGPAHGVAAMQSQYPTGQKKKIVLPVGNYYWRRVGGHVKQESFVVDHACQCCYPITT